MYFIDIAFFFILNMKTLKCVCIFNLVIKILYLKLFIPEMGIILFFFYPHYWALWCFHRKDKSQTVSVVKSFSLFPYIHISNTKIHTTYCEKSQILTPKLLLNHNSFFPIYKITKHSIKISNQTNKKTHTNTDFSTVRFQFTNTRLTSSPQEDSLSRSKTNPKIKWKAPLSGRRLSRMPARVISRHSTVRAFNFVPYLFAAYTNLGHNIMRGF